MDTTQNKGVLEFFAVLKKWEARHWLSVFLMIVALVLLGLSVTHLARGIAQETGDSPPLALCLAIGIDMGIIGCELAWVLATLRGYKGVMLPAGLLLAVMLVLSATMNSRSYTVDKELFTFGWWLCVVFGAFIPCAVFGFSKIVAGLLVGEVKPATQPSAQPPEPAQPGLQIQTPEELKEAWRAEQRYRRGSKGQRQNKV